ncbi:MAG: hypothetical protein QW683_08690 [Candidatus Caldarchaeum sp.]
MKVLQEFEPFYVHRGTPTNPIPSWGREGWFLTPQCVLGDDPAFDRVNLNSVGEDVYVARVKSIEGHVPVARIKSSHLNRGWAIYHCEDLGDYTVIHLYLPGVQKDFVGGIFSVAFYRETVEYAPHLESVTYAVDLVPTGDWAAIYNGGSPLVLDPRHLYSMRLYDDRGNAYQTAFVDPGFDGVLYVPIDSYHPDLEYRLEVTPYVYLGERRYAGRYAGTNRAE